MSHVSGFRWRRITPAQAQAIRHDHARGATLAVLAERYGVHVRTIARTLNRARREAHRVTVAGWTCLVEFEDDGPVQITPWQPLEAGA
jgi:predicted DNA-binding protein (UPF0251 family)